MKQNKDFLQKIIGQIQENKIKSKPKAYFILQTLVLLFIIGISIVIAVFLASFVAFGFHSNGSVFLLLALAFAVFIFFMLAFLLSEKLTFFYQKPFVFGFLALAFLIIVLTLIVFKTPFHQKVLDYAKQNEVPILSPLYRCGCGCGCSKGASCSCSQTDQLENSCLH